MIHQAITYFNEFKIKADAIEANRLPENIYNKVITLDLLGKQS